MMVVITKRSAEPAAAKRQLGLYNVLDLGIWPPNSIHSRPLDLLPRLAWWCLAWLPAPYSQTKLHTLVQHALRRIQKDAFSMKNLDLIFNINRIVQYLQLLIYLLTTANLRPTTTTLGFALLNPSALAPL